LFLIGLFSGAPAVAQLAPADRRPARVD
ncbi:MAG: hypothetical protein JWN70_1254, partial [Planctomycetaceae bacterium]|nr:hypothetical protein [Planctomycetaceae bacterium]